MKKITVILFCALLLISAGCSDAKTNVSNSSEALLTVNGKAITNGNVYRALSSSGNITPVLDAIEKQVVSKAVKVTDEMEENAKATLETTKKNVGAENWNNYIKESGFKDEDDYYKNSILLELRAEKLTETYINENFSNLVKQYEVKKLQIMLATTEKEADAKKALKKKNADFKAIAKEYGIESAYDGSEAIYTNQSGLPTAVWNNILKTEDGKVADTVLDQTTGNLYIVKVVSSEAKDFKEETIAAIKNITTQNEEGLTIDEIAFNYYLNKAGFEIHDADIYTLLLNNSKKYQED